MVKNLPAIQETPGSGRSPGGGQGNSLQYSFLENPMDSGAWRAIVHRIAKSWAILTCMNSFNLNTNSILLLRKKKKYSFGYTPMSSLKMPLWVSRKQRCFFFFSSFFLLFSEFPMEHLRERVHSEDLWSQLILSVSSGTYILGWRASLFKTVSFLRLEFIPICI